MGVDNGQFALHVFTAALVTVYGLVGFIEGAQDFVLFLAVNADVFINWHEKIIPRCRGDPFGLSKAPSQS